MFENQKHTGSIYFIGDVHGNFNKYNQLIKNYHPTIQIGDLGIGFDCHGEPTSRSMETCNAKFIRGNHDDPTACALMESCIYDGFTDYLLDAKTMFIGGALSIDKEYRTPGFDWWPDEEISIKRAESILKEYETYKPDLMVTHDAPSQITKYFERQGNLQLFNAGYSITKDLLSNLFNIHIPKMWIFGHYHTSLRFTFNGCKFIGLGIEEVYEFTNKDLSY